MYRKLTYIKHEYELELYRIDEYDENNKLIYNKISSQEGILETKISFDKNGNEILEENFVDGKKSDHTVTIYNKNNEVISISVYIQDELYEKTVITKSEFKEVSISTVDDLETNKTTTELKENKSITTIFEHGEFVSKIVSEDKEQGRKETIYNEQNEIVNYQNFEFDGNDNILRHEIFSDLLEPISTEIHSYTNNNLVSIAYESLTESEYYSYEYNEKNVLLHKEIKDGQGNIIEFVKSKVDEKGRDTEVVFYGNGSHVHYEIKYEEIN